MGTIYEYAFDNYLVGLLRGNGLYLWPKELRRMMVQIMDLLSTFGTYSSAMKFFEVGFVAKKIP